MPQMTLRQTALDIATWYVDLLGPLLVDVMSSETEINFVLNQADVFDFVQMLSWDECLNAVKVFPHGVRMIVSVEVVQ